MSETLSQPTALRRAVNKLGATRILRSKFVRNVAIMATGTAAAQAIAIAFSPLITRIYGPEAFGLLGTFSAVLAVVTPIAALAYPIAIVLPKDDESAVQIGKLSAYLACSIAAVLAVIILFWGDELAQLLGVSAISNYLLLIPVAMLFAAFQQILEKWLIRKKRFKIAAKSTVWAKLTTSIAKVGVGWYYPLGAVLIVLTTLTKAIMAGLFWLGIRRDVQARPNKAIQTTEPRPTLCMVAKQHWDFPVYRAPQVTINALSQNLPILMLAAFFGPAFAGFYTLAKTVMALPSTLLAKSVGDVFYPRIAEARNNRENLTHLITKATALLAGAGVMPFGIVFIFGPWLFAFVFGSEWYVAGEYARWLALWLFTAFINRPSVASIPVMELQGFFLVYELLSVALRGLALYLGFLILKDDVMTVMLFSFAGVMLNFMLIGATLIKSRAIHE